MDEELNSVFATIGFATVLRMMASMVALCLMVPALLINIDWPAGIASPWNLAAVGMIVGSAVFVEVARHARSWPASIVWGLFALVLCAVNVQTAFENSSHRSDHRSDHRKTAMVAAEKQSSQRSQWTQGRAQAATVAGETAAPTFQSQIDSSIAAEAGRWRASSQCDPLETRSAETKAFCSGIGNLKAKLAAAQRRDDLDRKIENLDARTGDATEVPTTADPFVESMAALVAIAGVQLDAGQKRAITAQKDLLKSIGLEMLATFGPAAWLAMVSGMFAAASHMATPSPSSADVRTKPEKVDMPNPAATKVQADVVPEPPVALDDPFHKFVSECLEEAPGVSVPAGEPWTSYLAWCAKAGLKPSSQKAFGTKMGVRFSRDTTNNRPRYLNIRVRKATPHLRVVG